ncbi:SPOSA6832_02792, partial [Sporobolomyces salmonicolor]
CLKGVLHEGTPVGQIIDVGGTEVYYTLPEGEDWDKEKAVVYLADYLNKDAVPARVMSDRSGWDMDAWRPRHGPADTRPPLDKVLKWLKEIKGVKKIGVSGYCFGGKYSLDLAIENAVDASVISHPGGIKLPGDLDKLLEVSSVPVLFNACETDRTKEADEKLGEGKYKPGYKQTYSPGCTHDLAVPEQKAGKERAFDEAAAWFKKYL